MLGDGQDLVPTKCQYWARKKYFDKYCHGSRSSSTGSGFFGKDNYGNTLTLKQSCAKTCGGGEGKLRGLHHIN